MSGDQSISWLMFFTLVAAIVIAAGAFLYFLRSQRNRDIAGEALAGTEMGSTRSGALPELIGIAVIALAAMGLLTAGYSSKSRAEIAQATPPVGSTGMAQPVGSAQNAKPYQPANPAPDNRVAPASSSAGVGSDNGADNKK